MTTARAADVGRAARWILLLCTLFGLATMHTMGHAGIDLAAHPPAITVAGAASTLTSFDAAEQAVAAMSPATGHGCTGDHCGGQPDHGGMTGWSVCLAILSGLAAIVLMVAALFSRARSLSRLRCGRPPGSGIPRPPPRGKRRLTLTLITVLRI